MKILKNLGVNIGFNQKLFLKVIKVVAAHFKENPDKAKHIAGELFLPALALSDKNP